MFGVQASSSTFGIPSMPSFGTPSSTPAFGTPSPAFGTPSPAFGTPYSTPALGTPSPALAFGTPSSTPAFATPSSTPSFGTPFSTPAFGAAASTPASGTPWTSSYGTGFGTSLFSTPQQQPQQSPLFQQSNPHLTTQMAPIAPLPFSLADRDIQKIVFSYKEEAANTEYAFKHLLFSVTDPQYRVKPAGVSDIMWTESMSKLEAMEGSNRERLWPQLVHGFKDLSQRLKLQDEVLVSDAERLRTVQSNVKLLQRHFQADTLPWVQRLQQKEQALQRSLLRVMRIIEALENKGCRMPFTKDEADLAQKLAQITRQVKGPGVDLSRRVQNLLLKARLQADTVNGGSYVNLPGSMKIEGRSLSEVQEVLQQQTEGIARLGTVLKRDIRDTEIMVSGDSVVTGAI